MLSPRWTLPWTWWGGRRHGAEEQAALAEDRGYRSPSPPGAIPGTPVLENPSRQNTLSRTPSNYPNMHSVPLAAAQVMTAQPLKALWKSLLLEACISSIKGQHKQTVLT